MVSITEALWLGAFAGRERRHALANSRITHLLNVSDTPSVLAADDGMLREVAWHPIVDFSRIPEDIALACLSTLHRMVCEDCARVYVHGMAGWNRSPTVVWLYLVACAMSPRAARALIEARAHDAVPAHTGLVDGGLVQAVTDFGAAHFLPHPRPEALVPS